MSEDHGPSFTRLMLTVSFWVGVLVACGVLLAAVEYLVPSTAMGTRVFVVGMAVGFGLSWILDDTIKAATWEADR